MQGNLTLQCPNQTSFLNLQGFLHWAPTLKDPILTNPFFLTLQGKTNFINIINKSYQCNGMRHHNNFLPNLLLAPVGGL